ncbi:LysM peptidoglycan-binding domain-containing protein [Bacteroidia bacterium]|nr:LysM peptidoglycan-binding domain-containing protein [Bacteroidia bacterium]
MKNITGFCTVLLAILQLNAQKSYEPFVKTLSQTGLSSYYSKDLEANINSWIKNENEVVSKMLGKFQAYEKDLEYITKDFGLPWFIKYIPAANTGLDVHFQSKTDGARGIWPLEYQIAKKYDLISNSYEDERLSFVKSSEAACQYLKTLYGIYKDWQKAILAFSIGPVRVNQLIRTNGTVHFNEFYTNLSNKEKEPLNQFYSAMTVLFYADTFGIRPIPYQRIPTDTVSCELPATFKTIEQFTNIAAETLADLNPSILRGSVPALKGTRFFKVPKTSKQAYQNSRDTIYTYSKYILHPFSIYDTMVKIIDSVEYIDLVQRPFGDFSVGKRIIVSIENTNKKSAMAGDNGSSSADSQTISDGREVKEISVKKQVKLVWITYIVKRKDALYTLSDIFDCTIKEIKRWNNMRGNGIYIGQRLRIKVSENRLYYYKKVNRMSRAQKIARAKQD